MLKEMIEFFIKSLVAHPHQVSISVNKSGKKTIFAISVADEDRGKVIGKEGQTIKAIRSIINLVAPEEKRIVIDIAK